MIVKLQKPIFPPDGPVLIYDQSREHETTQPFTAELAMLFGERLKFFCHAKMRGPVLIIDVSREVDDPGW